MDTSPLCPRGSDSRFGPRVDVNCRPFDFTLLFEDAFFEVLPAALFLLLLPSRLHYLRSTPVKLQSYRLAIWKLSLLGLLFLLHVLFTVFHVRTSALHTRLSVSSDILNIIAVFAAGVHSFTEDQRSVAPADILVLYFSASTVLSIPRLRTLWQTPDAGACRGLWTAVFVVTVGALLLESARKTRFLRPLYRSVTGEQLCGFWSRSFFVWVLPLFQSGYSKILEIDDMPEADDDLLGSETGASLLKAWGKTRGSSHRLLRASCRAFFWPFMSGVGPRLVYSGFTFCQPFLISAVVGFVDTPRSAGTEKYGQALIGAVVIVYLGLAVSGAVYWRQTFRLTTKLRSGLISVIYLQTTLLREQDVKDKGAVTLMGTDVERIVASLRFIHDAWASMVEVGIAVYLLERQLFLACLVPVVICILCIVAAAPLSSGFRVAQKQWVDWVEKRIATTSNMVSDMKAVKMLGLNDVLYTIVLQLRQAELKASERFRKLLIAQVVISNLPTDFAPFATFAVYAIVAAVKNDKSLLTSQAFESLSLISLLTNPLMMFCQAMPTLLQAVGSFDRIDEFLSKTPPPANTESSDVAPTGAQGSAVELQNRPASIAPAAPVASFQNCSISWAPNSQTVINNFTLDVWRGITMIIGPVGAGKSALLETLLGETSIASGSVANIPDQIAYCSQSPWMMNESVRHNITGGITFDEKWYHTTLWACALEDDLKRLPRGDMTPVGSNGVALSGGQRQRVALARAVYSRLPLIVLDDIFSGLDAKSINMISTRLLEKDGLIKKSGRSVILATHTQRVLPFADEIVVIADGRLADRGTYEDILRRSPDILAKSLPAKESKEGVLLTREAEPAENLGNVFVQSAVAEEEMDQSKSLLRRDGTWSVYKYYFSSAGYPLLAAYTFFCFLEGFASNFATVWFQIWMDANQKHPNAHLGLYLGLYAMFWAMSLTGIIMSLWLFFINVVNNTALRLHHELLSATLRAPFAFFQKTDVGSITNRFSQDMDLIDMALPRNAAMFTNSVASCTVKLVILCVAGKYLAVTTPFLAVALYFLQRYYLRTSRQVRILDIEAKAPLYTHFLETVQGATTVRAFGWREGFRARAEGLLARSQRPFYMLACIQQWLQLVLDLMVGALALVIVAMVTSMTGRFSAGSIGVALSLLLTFNQLLVQAIKGWTLLETSIGAVSRVRSFVEETPTEDRGVGPLPAEDRHWPSRGEVAFQNVTAGYDPHAPPVLKGLSLTIPAGAKVAVCGPSGSGKTSLILALLQMVTVQGGRVAVDGRDLAGVEGGDLRRRVNVVPQEPFFTPGSVRFNLAPHESEEARAARGGARGGDDDGDDDDDDEKRDKRLEEALRKVGLLDRVVAKGGLSAELVAGEWSAGERQLLALARAILRADACRILVLDEAASSVDQDTEAVMQAIIDREFAEQTVISVVHRLRYIDRFDRVALLKAGSLVEWDAPAALLARDSEFRRLYMALSKSD